MAGSLVNRAVIGRGCAHDRPRWQLEGGLGARWPDAYMARKRSLRTDGAGSLILGQFVIFSIASLQISRQPNLFNLADDFSGRRRHVLVAVAEHAAEQGAEVVAATTSWPKKPD